MEMWVARMKRSTRARSHFGARLRQNKARKPMEEEDRERKRGDHDEMTDREAERDRGRRRGRPRECGSTTAAMRAHQDTLQQYNGGPQWPGEATQRGEAARTRTSRSLSDPQGEGRGRERAAAATVSKDETNGNQTAPARMGVGERSVGVHRWMNTWIDAQHRAARSTQRCNDATWTLDDVVAGDVTYC